MKPRILQTIAVNRYPSFTVRINGKTERRKVHIEVLRAFIGPVPVNTEVIHIDGNINNPRLDNLRYA